MIQIVTGCTGDNCPKYKDCANYYENLSRTQKCSFPLESWSTFGSTTMWVDSKTEESGTTHDWFCGPNGNYKMFRPYMRPLSELTLGEVRSICEEQKKNGRDCEDCTMSKFCNYEMTTKCPSDWKLEYKEVEG